jgi:hypothetical protein
MTRIRKTLLIAVEPERAFAVFAPRTRRLVATGIAFARATSPAGLAGGRRQPR